MGRSGWSHRDAVVTFLRMPRTHREHVIETVFGMKGADQASSVEMMTFIRESHQVMPFLEWTANEVEGAHRD